jgi:hypothetical protein
MLTPLIADDLYLLCGSRILVGLFAGECTQPCPFFWKLLERDEIDVCLLFNFEILSTDVPDLARANG